MLKSLAGIGKKGHERQISVWLSKSKRSYDQKWGDSCKDAVEYSDLASSYSSSCIAQENVPEHQSSILR